jgi:hypothetical protein
MGTFQPLEAIGVFFNDASRELRCRIPTCDSLYVETPLQFGANPAKFDPPSPFLDLTAFC